MNTYTFESSTKKEMERLKRKSRWMFALEIILYFTIAISVALAIVLN